MVIDCVYNYTLADRDSLEVKWYFKQVCSRMDIFDYSGIDISGTGPSLPVDTSKSSTSY